MCAQKYPNNRSEELYARHGETIFAYLRDKVLPALNTLDNEQLLKEFVKRGINHGVMNNWYRKVLGYLVSSLFLEKSSTSFGMNLVFAGSLPREIQQITSIGRGGVGALQDDCIRCSEEQPRQCDRRVHRKRKRRHVSNKYIHTYSFWTIAHSLSSTIGSSIIDLLGSEKISQRQSRFNCNHSTYINASIYIIPYIHIHRMNSSSSSAAGFGSADKESSDDPQFTLSGGHGSKYQQGISFVYFLVLISLIITTGMNNFVKADDDFGGAEVQASKQDIAAQEAAWAQQSGESLPSKRFGRSQPQHIHT